MKIEDGRQNTRDSRRGNLQSNDMNWIFKILFPPKKNCKHQFRESDVFCVDDPRCVDCYKLMSEIHAEEGKPFEKKSIKRRYEEMFDEMDKFLTKTKQS